MTASFLEGHVHGQQLLRPGHLTPSNISKMPAANGLSHFDDDEIDYSDIEAKWVKATSCGSFRRAASVLISRLSVLGTEWSSRKASTTS